MSDVGPYIFFKSCPLKVFGSHHCVWMISFSKYIYFNSQHLKNKGKSKIKLSGLVGACWSRKLFQFCKWLSRNLIRNIFLIFQFRNNDRIQSVMTVRLIFKTFDFSSESHHSKQLFEMTDPILDLDWCYSECYVIVVVSDVFGVKLEKVIWMSGIEGTPENTDFDKQISSQISQTKIENTTIYNFYFQSLLKADQSL